MTHVNSGLEGVIAAETRLSRVDGQLGELIIGGFPLEELAQKATFEETVYLLWHDVLPDSDSLAIFRQALQAHRVLPQATLTLLEAAAGARLNVMDALRMAAGSLSLTVPDDNPSGDPQRDALVMVAAFPTIVAAYWRLYNGQPGH
jgi:citrate synthase